MTGLVGLTSVTGTVTLSLVVTKVSFCSSVYVTLTMKEVAIFGAELLPLEVSRLDALTTGTEVKATTEVTAGGAGVAVRPAWLGSVDDARCRSTTETGSEPVLLLLYSVMDVAFSN